MAAAVQVKSGLKYERTTDPKRMLTSALLTEAIRTDWKNIKGFLPARTATYVQYEAGGIRAVAWNVGETKTRVYLPLEDGWYVPDGNRYALPTWSEKSSTGQKSGSDNPKACYFMRSRIDCYAGPILCSGDAKDGIGRSLVYAYYGQPTDSGVALTDRAAALLALTGLVPAGKLADLVDPKKLRDRAAQLRATATELGKHPGGVASKDSHAKFIKPTLDEASFLTELAGKIEAIKQKA